MNRRYRSGEYEERCALLRKYYDAPALTTDVIVGFPMETEEEFEKSYEFVKKIGFYETHIFPYSRRQGTKAAAMEGQLTEQKKKERSEKMIALHHIHAREYEESMLGKTLEVLLEEEVRIGDELYFTGHSREYVKVAVKKQERLHVNDLIKVEIRDFAETHTLTGEIKF